MAQETGLLTLFLCGNKAGDMISGEEDLGWNVKHSLKTPQNTTCGLRQYGEVKSWLLPTQHAETIKPPLPVGSQSTLHLFTSLSDRHLSVSVFLRLTYISLHWGSDHFIVFCLQSIHCIIMFVLKTFAIWDKLNLNNIVIFRGTLIQTVSHYIKDNTETATTWKPVYHR